MHARRWQMLLGWPEYGAFRSLQIASIRTFTNVLKEKVHTLRGEELFVARRAPIHLQ